MKTVSSIREVAKHAGVSPATVSRAFAAPNLINEQTKRRVLDSARTLEYRPPHERIVPGASPRQRLEKQGDSTAIGTIGFQFFSSTDAPGDTLAANNFYAPVLSGAQAEASLLGIHLLVDTISHHRLMVEAPRMVRERAVDGLLLVGRSDTDAINAFARYVPTVILVDHYDTENRFESIISDSFGGSRALTRHLVALGHRQIAFFLGGTAMGTFQLRESGYLCALFDAGISARRDYVIGASDDEAVVGDELRSLLGSPDRPTAIVAANDHNALIALRVCRELGLRVPGDISVAGFDDIEFASHADPPLTTVRVDKEAMGRYAVRRLWDRLKRRASRAVQEDDPPICHVMPVAQVLRDSCSPPPASKRALLETV